MPNETQASVAKRRLPAIEKHISDITIDEDVRVRILGTVLEASEASLLIDDGSGKAEVTFDDENSLNGVSKGHIIRVVARVLPLIDGYVLKGECVQTLEGFDINLYKRAKQITV